MSLSGAKLQHHTATLTLCWGSLSTHTSALWSACLQHHHLQRQQTNLLAKPTQHLHHFQSSSLHTDKDTRCPEQRRPAERLPALEVPVHANSSPLTLTLQQQNLQLTGKVCLIRHSWPLSQGPSGEDFSWEYSSS